MTRRKFFRRAHVESIQSPGFICNPRLHALATHAPYSGSIGHRTRGGGRREMRFLPLDRTVRYVQRRLRPLMKSGLNDRTKTHFPSRARRCHIGCISA
jgi:hypothetical protein